VDWLTSLPVAVLVAGWLAIAVLTVGAGRLLVRTVVPLDEQDQVGSVAAPLMPALGATFAVLIAVTLSSEAGYLREAQKVVSDEAAAAARLAWAATSPRVTSEPVQSALAGYLQATRDGEWRGDRAAEGDVDTERVISTLERAVRTEAARGELGTPASTELLTSVDAVTSARRARLAAASRQVPGLYVVTLVGAGLALVGNAGALTYRTSRRTSILVVGLAAVVGLSLALLFALAAPWRGPLTVDGSPLDSILLDLRSGFFER
jgi:Protein of unknown function (DUF4239)